MSPQVAQANSSPLDPYNRSWLLGLLGEHIQGSRTPSMHEGEARRQGLLLSYRSLDTVLMRAQTTHARGTVGAATDWPRIVELAGELTFDGLNVTHPAKQAVLPALDELSDEAMLLGAVNTIQFTGGRVLGKNTDHAGFTDALDALAVRQEGAELDLSDVVQLGAGGAGSAAAYGLLSAGAERLTLVDVEESRAETLIKRLSAAFDASRMRFISLDDAPDAVRRATGLVNTTPIGMTGVSETSPIDVEALHSSMWVGDVVYRPLKTELVKAAESIGCAAFGGIEMVVGQAAVAFELFTGLKADRDAMKSTFLAMTEDK